MAGQIWIHSDWHWRHENIYRFTWTAPDGIERRIRGRFADVQEGDAYIEQRIRDLVKAQDHLWFLGDLTMFRENHMAHDFVRLFSSLPGHKTLIPGNHDHLNARHYVDAGLKIRGSRLHDGMLFSHFPIHASSLSFKVKGNCHGHTHQQPDLPPLARADGTIATWLNVSVERTDYEPIPIEEVAKRLEARKASVNLPPRATDVSGNPVEGP